MLIPHSNNHCEPCAFTDLLPADPGKTLQAEVDMVWDHLNEVVDPPNTAYRSKRIQEKALEAGVRPERLLAARMCAKVINNGDCPLFVFINRGRGNRFKLETRAEAI